MRKFWPMGVDGETEQAEWELEQAQALAIIADRIRDLWIHPWNISR